MINIERILTKYIWVFLILLLIPAFWALFIPGYFGASDDIHMAWLYEMHKTLLMGKFPPRFVPDLSFGFGYPLFNFAFPLPFYISEIFHLSGLSLVDSVKGLFFTSIPLSFIFMYFLLRQFTSYSLSLAGAFLYVYTPYRSVDLYVRGAIGEVLSFVFLPLIVLSVVKLDSSKNIQWIGVGGLALASLVLSHNITAYMFLPFVLLFFLMQFFVSLNRKVFLKKFILMFLLGLLISLYFWLPAVVDSKLMKYDTVFNFADHYPTILQLITPYWGYGASVPGPGDGISFFLGIVNLLVLIFGIIGLVSYWNKISKVKKIFLIWALISIASVIFMMNYRSVFFWNIIPFLPYFQFPWRFLMVTTFSIPILVVALEKFGHERGVAAFLIVFTVISTGTYFRPQDFLGRKDDYYINRYIPTPQASKEYKKTQEEYLRLPQNTEVRPNRNYPLVTSSDVNILENINLNGLDTTLKIESEKGGIINYNKYLFPGWVVKIDEKVIQLSPGSPFGQITFYVPAGVHKVEVNFEETIFKKILDAISFLSFLVSLWMVKNLWLRSKKIGSLFWD